MKKTIRAATLVLLILAALAFTLSAVCESGGLSWPERLEQARKKYNEKTVNVYERGHGKNQKNKINVRFYPSSESAYMTINIRESLDITDEAEMEAILEVIAQSKYYNSETYGTIGFMKAEWIAHNLAHAMATGSEQQQEWVTTFAGTSLKKAIGSAKELDLSPLESISSQHMALYEFVEYFLVKGQ